VTDDPRLDAARARFFALHAEDPRRVRDGEREVSFETAYHARLERWVDRLDPEAGPPLRLAAMCQHVGRHALPRSDFPEGVLGYKKWRATQAQRHARIAEEVLRATGWDEATVLRVRELLTKKGLGRDPDVQLLEDAVCVAFLDGELAEFAAKHPEEKVIDVLQKTWAKMSPAGHAAALPVVRDAPAVLRTLVDRALGSVP
jgi:hypothetical protein